MNVLENVAGQEIQTRRLGAFRKILMYGLVLMMFPAMIIGTLYVRPLIAPVLAIPILILAAYRWLFAWRNLLFLFIASILLVPSNIYKLPSIIPFDLEIYRLVAMLILILWVVALLIDLHLRLRKTPFDFQMLSLILVVFLSLLVNLSDFEPSEEFAVAVKAFLYFTTFILLFYFIISTFRTTDDVESALKFIVFLGAIVSVFGIIERLTGYNIFRHLHEWVPLLRADPYLIRSQLWRGGIRVAGSLAHPIAFSALLAMIAPLAWHYWQSAKKSLEKLGFGLSFALIVVTIILTGSRTGFVGLVAVLILLLIGTPKKRLLILGSTLVVFFAVHMLFPGALGAIRATLVPSYIERTEIGNPEGRIEDYPRIWQEFVKKPLFGRGYGTFDPRKFFYVDNQYLKFVVEIGLLGSLVFASFLYRVLSQFWRSARLAKKPHEDLFISLTASSLVFVVVCATFDTFGFPQVPYLFFIMVALGTALALNSKSISEPAGVSG